MHLSGALQTVTLPPVRANAIAIRIAGRGFVSLDDARSPFADTATVPLAYVRVAGIQSGADLTVIPGFSLDLTFVPHQPVRVAAREKGGWITVGEPGVARGKHVTFAAIAAHPPIHLPDGASYEMLVYTGDVIPPTPSPSPSPTPSPTLSPSPTPSPTPSPSPTASPTPGPMTVGAVCTQAGDTCAAGTTSVAGSVQFYALGDTATLTPSESGPAATFTLSSDTCNTTDDPSAGGNWATFSPAAGQSGTAFTVTARNGGANGNPSHCTAVFADNHGQSVTIDVGVTVSNIGINAK